MGIRVETSPFPLLDEPHPAAAWLEHSGRTSPMKIVFDVPSGQSRMLVTRPVRVNIPGTPLGSVLASSHDWKGVFAQPQFGLPAAPLVFPGPKQAE